MIRDRIMCGVESDLVRQKIIEKGAALTLTDAITTTRTYETVQSQLAAMTPPTAIKQEVDSAAASSAWMIIKGASSQ